MKQLIFFLSLISSMTLLGQVDFPITFEDESVNYDFDDFGGNASSIVVDPTDMGNMVVQSTRTAGAEFFAGTSVGNSGFVSAIPFTETATGITVRVWSPLAGISVKLKVEKNDNPTISVETDATTTVAMEWETLTFDFSNQSPGTAELNLASVYDKVSIFFNFGAEGAEEQIYYWDDVIFTGMGGPPAPDFPITFEDEMLDYALSDFGGNASSIIVDPTDATNMVVESVRTAASESFAGTSVANSGLENPIPFTNAATMMTVRVWSPAAGVTVKLKAEDAGNGAISVETDAMTTVAMEWETLTFDMSNPSENTPALNLANEYDKVSIFFNFGATGVGEQVYYWDDVNFVEVILPNLPITFEDEMLDYALSDFGGNASSIIEDPTDATNTVVQSIRTAASESFAGTSVANNGLENPIPFMSFATMMTVRVWSPAAGVSVKLKVENAADGNISVETDAVTTVAMEWETLTFDFSAPSEGTPGLNLSNVYDKASIFFDFGATGVAEQTYYWDDVEFVNVDPPTLPELPLTFEEDMLDYGFDDFGGNASSIIADPTDATNTVVQSIRTAEAEFFAGTSVGNNSLANPIPFTETATTMTVRVWSPIAGIPVKLKVEKFDNVTISVETDAMTTVAMEWETLTFDFSNQSPGTAELNLASTYNKISIFFNFGAEGEGEQIYFWDDVEFGGGVEPVLPDLPITFEDDMLDYDLEDFGGNASSIIVDPTDATNMVAQSIRAADALSFAGTTAGNNGLANPIPFTAEETTMTVRVWSPAAGIPVKFKVENAGDATISVETDAFTTVAMEWETIGFDFANESTGTAELNLANTYDKASIFFNFGAEGVGEQIYFWDDIEFGPIVGAEVLPAGAYGIKVAPNPTNDFAVVTLPETITERATLKLHNSNGQVVQTSVITPGQTTIYMEGLAAGMYVLSIHTNEAIYIQKVIKS